VSLKPDPTLQVALGKKKKNHKQIWTAANVPSGKTTKFTYQTVSFK